MTAETAPVQAPPRLMITGSRTWTDRAAIRDALKAWWETTGRNPDAVLVSGACPKGADRIAEEIWESNGLTVERHPADWRPGGVLNRRAGYDRNKAMVDSAPDHVLAFRHNKSGGTTHAYNYAVKTGIPADIIDR